MKSRLEQPLPPRMKFATALLFGPAMLWSVAAVVALVWTAADEDAW